MPGERLSNVVGAPFPEFVLTQLQIRQNRGSVGTGPNGRRSNNEILYLANKMSWVKLTSSVNVVPDGKNISQWYQEYNLDTDTYNNEDSLRKNWILQAGTSFSEGNNGITLRQGFGPEGAYGMGGTKSSGYRPMPGLTNVVVESKGTLGSLREANVDFKVWNIEQLNIIEAIYFRLGYSMLLEWGHVQYFDNLSPRDIDGTFTTNTGGINAFTDVRKEFIQQEIAKKRKKTDGNYDGMLGIVSNFTWSYNQEGGYDCTLKIIGLGSIIDTLRINLSYKMPDAIFIAYEKQQKSIEKQIQEAKERDERKNLDALERASEALQDNAGPLPPLATTVENIYNPIFLYDQPGTNLSFVNFIEQVKYFSHNNSDFVTPISFVNYYYQASGVDNLRLNNQRTGLYLMKNSDKIRDLIPADVKPTQPQPVVLDSKGLESRADKITQINFLGLSETSFKTNLVLNTFLAQYVKSPNFKQSVNNKDFFFPITDGRKSSLDFTVYSNINKKTRFSIVNDIDYTIQKELGDQAFNIEQLSFVFTYQQDVNLETETQSKQFYFIFKIIKPFGLSWIEALITLQNWFDSSTPTWNITQLETVTYNRDNSFGLATFLEGLTEFFGSRQNIPASLGGSYSYKDLLISGPLQLEALSNQTITPTITFTTNDPAYITQVLTRPPQQEVIPLSGQLGNTGNTTIIVNNANAPQQDESQKFASAIHAMLYAVKSDVQTQAGLNPKLTGNKVSILKITKKFFTDGVLDGIFETGNENIGLAALTSRADQLVSVRPGSLSIQTPVEVPFDLIPYAKKGFASSLMADPSLFDNIQDVDFDSLCTASYIKFNIQDNTNPYNYPVYIKFGYLLAFLNSMCLIYDSKQDTDKRPYVYIDFNPEYNFCLTSPYHLSVDPLTCMIPYEGTEQDYRLLFPEGIRDSITPLTDDPKKRKGLTPEKNVVSKFIPEFKSPDNAYQGKIMEILLSVDFLLDTLKSFTSNDPAHAINLKGFLDAVVVGINKSCGNINLFRVSYDDESNTVVIKDDQFVPNRSDEPNIINKQKASQLTTKLGNARYGMIPIYGLNSMVREFEFKTNVNTAMSKQIAISAQAKPNAVNQTDHSSFSWLNRDYVDAYKPLVTDSQRLTSNSNNSTKKENIQVDLDQAEKFNSHILAIYQGGEYLNPGRIDFAINYYISSMADLKALDSVTYAAPFISANLSMTVDGISGITMGNAFTIPEDRLPISLRGNNVTPKVGFIVAGLTHTLDNNQWLTKIKGQMIRLTDVPQYTRPTPQPGTEQPKPPQNTSRYPGACPDTTDPKTGKIIKGYSGAQQVPEPQSINIDNVKEYYPYLPFVRGTNSNIPVRNDIPILVEKDIINDTTLNRFDIGVISAKPKYFVIHHTGGGTTAEDIYTTFYCRGLPAQYVIDKQGRIHRFMPDGTKGLHAGGSDENGTNINNTSIGVEIIAGDDSKVTDAQVIAAVRLARYLGFNKEQVIGHGAMSQGRKQATEGSKVVNFIKTL